MIKLTANDAVRKALSKLDQPAEIQDAGGNIIGYFTPINHEEARLYREAAARFEPEQMQQRKDSGAKGFTTAEVLEHLKSLEKS